MDDIRVSLGFFDHPKTLMLNKSLGLEGVFCLLRLWAFAALYRPTGVLLGMQAEEIELAAKWQGEAGLFFAELKRLHWLDCEGEDPNLHDWKDWQPWIIGATARRAKARKAAQASWSKRQKSDAPSNAPSKAHSNAPAMPLTSPSLTSPITDTDTTALFARVWAEYPKHSAKERAWQIFEEIGATEELINKILGALRWQKRSQDFQRGARYIPYLATYLRDRRFEDEPPEDLKHYIPRTDQGAGEDRTRKPKLVYTKDGKKVAIDEA